MALREIEPNPQQQSVKVSVIIKALNEEGYIEAAIRSALLAVEPFGGEVILADSLSTDGTVEIARQFPIVITQLKHAADRRCGVGPQLGFQVARGEFIYILDGDMELDPQFLAHALQAMMDDPKRAGVAGLVEEKSEASYQFRGRKRRRREGEPGSPPWLDMGGLYRAVAVNETGYFSNRNLHSYEEMDLGLRLTDAGWNLRRLPVRSVLHHGYSEGTWVLLWRRWRSRYLDGVGEILHAAWGKRYFRTVLFSQKHYLVGLLVWLGLVFGFLLLPLTPWLLGMVLLGILVLVLLRAIRIGSFLDSCLAQVVWQVTSLAMLRGYMAKKVDPCQPIESRSIPSQPDFRQFNR